MSFGSIKDTPHKKLMDGFIVEEDEEIVRRREDGDSLASSHVHT